MATITSVQSGNWSSTSTWSPAQVPGLGDKVTIAATHIVTLNGIYSVGDDTQTALTINGTLKGSRTANTGLTLRGNLVMSSTTGVWDFGTESNPIPAAYTCVLVFNDSAAMATLQYSINIAPSVFRMWGATKTLLSKITTINSQSSFVVADATGWQVGDYLFLASTAIGTSTTEARAISTITPGSGTTATITITAAASNTHYVGRAVANVSRNVKIGFSQPTLYQSMFQVRIPSTVASNSFEIGYVESVGGRGRYDATGLSLGFSDPAAFRKSEGISVHDVISIAGSTVTAISITNSSSLAVFACDKPSYFDKVTVCSKNNADGITSVGGARFTNPVTLGTNYAIAGMGQIGGGSFITIVNPTCIGFGTAFAGTYQGGIQVSGGTFDGFYAFQSGNTIQALNCVVQGASFAPTLGMNATNILFTYEAFVSIIFDGCTFPSNVTYLNRAANPWNTNYTGDLFLLTLKSKNNDQTYQEAATTAGRRWRENSITHRGTSSMRLDPWYAGRANSYSINVNLAANQTSTFVGATRWGSVYGSGTPPTVTISGGGVTTVTHTNSVAVDTWQDYSLTVTNPYTYQTTVTITYSAQTSAATDTAYAYFDGVYDAPWVSSTRHFGYQFLPQSYVTSDSRITLSESAALASGVAVNHTSQTITVTGSLTNAQVFQACMADLCQTANQAVAVHISSVDGANFTTTYTVSGTVTGNFTDAAGVHTSIAVSGILAGSRVQIYNLSTSTELYNGIPGTNISLSALWTTNQSIRMRVGYASGTTAMIPIETLGLLTANGTTFIATQVNDTIYNAIAIDGSTCTEFIPDFPHLLIDISDASGVTTVQRVYAWACYNQTTSSGIATMFNSLTADDTANFVINTNIVDIKLDNLNSAPVILSGGYLSRSDGTTVIAATSGSIQLDPGKAYIAAGSATANDIWNYSDRTLTSVIPSAVDIATQVRTELDVELAHLMALENNPGLTDIQATMLLEIYRLYGLDPTKPLVVTQGSRSVTGANITQTITSGAIQTTIVRN